MQPTDKNLELETMNKLHMFTKVEENKHDEVRDQRCKNKQMELLEIENKKYLERKKYMR